MTKRIEALRRHRASVVTALYLLLICISPAARAVIDTGSYQVPMAPQPRSVTEAIATLPVRKETVIRVMACGSEFSFIEFLRNRDNGEGITAFILGKVAWPQFVGQYPMSAEVMSAPCEFTVPVAHWQVCKLFDDGCRSGDEKVRQAAETAFLTHPAWMALTRWSTDAGYAPDVEPLRARILEFLPEGCRDGSRMQQYSISASTPSTAPPAQVRLTFRITRRCLVAQAEAALLDMSRGEKQLGTEGVPCHVFSSTNGDWDATLKDLIRIAELDRRDPVLSDDARRHLNEQLIDVDGGPAQERYHLWECGNEERSVGSPQERSDEHEGFDSLLGDLFDTLEDLFWILVIVVGIAVAVALYFGGPLAVAIGAAAAVAGTAIAAATLLTFPETENHLWMINSTKYLNNQYIIANGGTGYRDDQRELREWILEELQRVMRSDFLEYNSRPYQRYSLLAILNLADFAEDEDVRTGARLVLEYALAKYSVSSSEGRRIVPYRRKRGYLRFVDGIPRDGTALTTTNPPKNGLFDLSQGADHLHALGLLYYGMSLNLPGFDGHPYAASTGYAGHAIYYATSGYRPDETTYSLAMERSRAPLVHQRLHHHGWEIVSSGASFTITAGGLTTGMPKNTTIDAIDQLKVPDDLGTAVPTMVMFAGPPDVPATFTQPAVPRPAEARRSTFDRFLRFEGKRPDAIDEAPSYDLNLCVWDGFACGVNLVVPGDLKAPCMKPGHLRNWFLVRSDDPDCPAYRNGPKFWMVLYDEPHFGSDVGDFGPVYSVGFVEIVDGGEMSFEEFRSRVAQRNPGPGTPVDISGDCEGVYVSARGSSGQRIEFDCQRVTKVDGIEQPDPDDWVHAGAPSGALGYAPIQSDGSGRVEITSRIARRKVTLDFQNRDDPMFIPTALP